MNYTQAKFELQNAPIEYKEAIDYLLAQQRKKEVKALKISNPYKLASMFRAKRDKRKHLNYIYSNGSKLIASNGYIAIEIDHVAPEGYYDDLGAPLSGIECRYSSFDRAFSFNLERVCIEFKDEVEMVRISGKKYVSDLAFGNIMFNKKYVDLFKKAGATGGVYNGFALIVDLPKHNARGIIMPLRF